LLKLLVEKREEEDLVIEMGFELISLVAIFMTNNAKCE
jgi:hypothetical protein